MSDFAALLEAIAALVTPLFWPAVVVAVLYLFKDEIRELLGRLRRGVILGQEIELEESLSQLKQTADEAASEVAALPPGELREAEAEVNAIESRIVAAFPE